MFFAVPIDVNKIVNSMELCELREIKEQIDKRIAEVESIKIPSDIYDIKDKISAIKELRDRLGISLRLAKCMIDNSGNWL